MAPAADDEDGRILLVSPFAGQVITRSKPSRNQVSMARTARLRWMDKCRVNRGNTLSSLGSNKRQRLRGPAIVDP